MSLDKAIQHHKEHRKPYYDSRRWDHTCRNHGSCGYCLGNRTFSYKKEQNRTKDELDLWAEEDEEGLVLVE